MSHLGGYISGGDEATWFPDLWRWLVEDMKVRSVLDVGCGDGQAIEFFADLGCSVLGIEGVEQNHPAIIQHDFTDGPAEHGSFDLCWCCEFVEHVEEGFIPNFLSSFRSAKTLLMTHADPGQPGFHHVNCRSSEYWVGVMAAAGFSLDVGLTAMSRVLAARNSSPWNHFLRSGMAFRRADTLLETKEGL